MKFQLDGGIIDADLSELQRLLSSVTPLSRAVLGTIVSDKSFLEGVAKALQEKYLPETRVTSSEAWQIWKAVDEAATAYQAQTRDYAELAFWFHINPYEVSERQRVGLLANLGMLKAQDRINRGDYDALDPKQVYQLFMLAYEDKELAQRRATESAKLAIEREAKRQRT